MIYSKSFLKRARRSKQTTFEPSAVLPDDEGRVFITSVPGAPVRVLGRLGRDGKWYIGQAGIEPPHEEEQREYKARLEELEARGVIVLRDEPVAEQMVRQGIRRLLSQPGLEFRDLFLARLRTSRFKDEERLQHHLDAFDGLPDEPTWLMANCAYATATKPMEGETPEETKAPIDSTISIKRKIRPMTESA